MIQYVWAYDMQFFRLWVCLSLTRSDNYTKIDAQKQCDISSLWVLRPGSIVPVLTPQFWLKTHSPSAFMISLCCDKRHLWLVYVWHIYSERVASVCIAIMSSCCVFLVWIIIVFPWFFTCISFGSHTHKLHCCSKHCGVVAYKVWNTRIFTRFSEFILHAFLSPLCVLAFCICMCFWSRDLSHISFSCEFAWAFLQIWIWSGQFRSFRLLRGGVSKRAINYAQFTSCLTVSIIGLYYLSL